MKVQKFGGTSVKDADQIRRAQEAFERESDNGEGIMVVSAPAGMTNELEKVALLYAAGEDWRPLWRSAVLDRFDAIIGDASVSVSDLGLPARQAEVAMECRAASREFIVSRGEAFNQIVVAAMMDATVVDPTQIFFKNGGRRGGILNMERSRAAAEKLFGTSGRYVVGGFHGLNQDGSTWAFARGGSDGTAAKLGALLNREVIIWTDVPGIMTANPQIVGKNAHILPALNCAEVEELANHGAKVLDRTAVPWIAGYDLRLRVKSTNDPDAGETLVSNDVTWESPLGPVAGVTGREPFVIIEIHKIDMDDEVGFMLRALRVLEEWGIPLHHAPSGNDRIELVVSASSLGDQPSRRLELIQDLRTACSTDDVRLKDKDMARIAVVGRGIANDPRIISSVTGALADNGTEVLMFSKTSDAVSMTIGVPVNGSRSAVKCIHDALFPSQDAA